jgi:phosphotransferase system  glucose/maltose/N-acetylglucosamine-specific IIC component
MKTNSVPAVIMLIAGFIDCVISIHYRLSLWEFTKQLFWVLVIFYLIGCVVKIVLDRSLKLMADEPEEEAEEPEGQGEETLETDENTQEEETAEDISENE